MQPQFDNTIVLKVKTRSSDSTRTSKFPSSKPILCIGRIDRRCKMACQKGHLYLDLIADSLHPAGQGAKSTVHSALC